MPPPDIETEMHALLADLDGDEPEAAIVRAQAMIGAATCFLTRLGGHAAVVAMLRRDADTVASYAPRPGEPRAPTGSLQ